MTIRLRVIDRSGNEHEVDAEAKGALMQVLRDFDFGVAAICGGMCSCATCHVYVDPAWCERLPASHGDEVELMLELQHRRENSRLSCQVQLSEALDGLGVTVAPEE
jgi:ferredoxin, 2Fe-2S